jgi:hypothetical protein
MVHFGFPTFAFFLSNLFPFSLQMLNNPLSSISESSMKPLLLLPSDKGNSGIQASPFLQILRVHSNYCFSDGGARQEELLNLSSKTSPDTTSRIFLTISYHKGNSRHPSDMKPTAAIFLWNLSISQT